MLTDEVNYKVLQQILTRMRSAGHSCFALLLMTSIRCGQCIVSLPLLSSSFTMILSRAEIISQKIACHR